MLSVEDWAEIRRLSKSEGLSIKEIVRQLGVARNTVRTALRSDEPPAYRRERSGSIVDAVELVAGVPFGCGKVDGLGPW